MDREGCCYSGAVTTVSAGSLTAATLLAMADSPIQPNARMRKKLSRDEVAGCSSCLTLSERAMGGFREVGTGCGEVPPMVERQVSTRQALFLNDF